MQNKFNQIIKNLKKTEKQLKIIKKYVKIYIKNREETNMKTLPKTNDDQINIFDVSNYIIQKNPYSTTHMKLHKLIFYSYVKHLLTFKKKLINEPIEAWLHGPVFPKLYSFLKKYTFQKINSILKEGNSNKISGDIKKSIDFIIKRYGQCSGQVLSDKTHFEDPWRNAFNSGKNVKIEDDVLFLYYSKRTNKI